MLFKTDLSNLSKLDKYVKCYLANNCYCIHKKIYGLLAQLVEQLTLNHTLRNEYKL